MQMFIFFTCPVTIFYLFGCKSAGAKIPVAVKLFVSPLLAPTARSAHHTTSAQALWASAAVLPPTHITNSAQQAASGRSRALSSTASFYLHTPEGAPVAIIEGIETRIVPLKQQQKQQAEVAAKPEQFDAASEDGCVYEVLWQVEQPLAAAPATAEAAVAAAISSAPQIFIQAEGTQHLQVTLSAQHGSSRKAAYSTAAQSAALGTAQQLSAQAEHQSSRAAARSLDITAVLPTGFNSSSSASGSAASGLEAPWVHGLLRTAANESGQHATWNAVETAAAGAAAGHVSASAAKACDIRSPGSLNGCRVDGGSQLVVPRLVPSLPASGGGGSQVAPGGGMFQIVAQPRGKLFTLIENI